jgi:hypothetical protein
MKTASILIAALLLAGIAFAQRPGSKIVLTCDPPPPTDVVRGYILYKQDATGTGLIQIAVYTGTERRFEVPQPIIGGSSYVLTAYNEVAESEPSDPLVMPGRPGKPLNTKVTIEFGQ